MKRYDSRQVEPTIKTSTLKDFTFTGFVLKGFWTDMSYVTSPLQALSFRDYEPIWCKTLLPYTHHAWETMNRYTLNHIAHTYLVLEGLRTGIPWIILPLQALCQRDYEIYVYKNPSLININMPQIAGTGACWALR